MPLRHSTPARSSRTQYATKLSQSSPALAETETALSFSILLETPRRAICKTSPSNPLSEMRTLLPPPRTKMSSDSFSANAKASPICVSFSAITKKRAGPPIFRVVRGPSGTSLCNSKDLSNRYLVLRLIARQFDLLCQSRSGGSIFCLELIEYFVCLFEILAFYLGAAKARIRSDVIRILIDRRAERSYGIVVFTDHKVSRTKLVS